MSQTLGFVVRVGAGALDEAPEFLGTGLLIAPARVLTCRHVVLERDPTGRPTDVPVSDLRVETGEGRQVRAKAPIMDPAWDLALLELEEPLSAAPPPLLWGIVRALEARLRRAPLVVVGYAQVEHRGPLWQHPVADLFRLASYRQGSETLTQLQLAGGIPAGCSGAPALLPLGGRWAYAGTLYLGGERAAASRLIMADPVAEFLATAGLQGLARIDATRALAVPPTATRTLELLIERPAHPLELPNPYRGLQAFREIDAPYFHGRETETQALYRALRDHPLVSLIGASGSGKSSLLFAGLVPRLRAEGHWRIASFRPKGDPFGELASALAPLLYPDRDKLERRKRRNRLARDLAAGALSPSDVLAVLHEERPEARLLLVADQLEELYTQNLPRDRQRQLLAGLAELVQSQDATPHCTLLLSLRADFLGRLLGEAPLAELFKRHPKEFLGPMDEARLRAAIAGPAAQLGASLESGLAERILQDLGEEPGNLPLLEFALTELWERQERGTLTHGAYEAIGGVGQSLAHHADAVLARYPDPEPLRRIFVQLVRPGEGTEDTRQIATKEQVGEASWPLVKELADKRLVVTGREEDREQETLEVVHEALIRHWQPLREWIDADRQFRTWQNRLRQALKDWEDSGRDEDALLRGARLAEAEERLDAHRDSLTTAERDYIAAGIAQREREGRARRRRTRFTMASLAAGLLITIGLSLWVNHERQKVDRQRIVAEEQRELALARQLAAQATLALTSKPTDLVKGALLATESLKRAQTVEAGRAWTQAMDLLPRSVLRLVHEGTVGNFAVSPDGKRLVTLENQGLRVASGEVLLWDIASRESRAKVTYQGGVTALAFSPNGKLLASASWDQTVVLVDTADGREIFRLKYESPIWSLAFSPDGDSFATGERDGAVRIRSTGDGQELVWVSHDGGVVALAFDPRGNTLATASDDNTIRIWNPTTGEELRSLRNDSTVKQLIFSPDGKRLATAHRGDPKVRIWDITSGEAKTELTHGGYVRDIAFSPNWDRLVTANWDGRRGTAQLWDVDTGKKLVAFGDERGVTGIAFGPDGSRLATFARSSQVILWDAVTARKLVELPQKNTLALAFSRDGKHLATAGEDAARLWDAITGKEVARFPGRGFYDMVTFSPDGAQLVTVDFQGPNQPFSRLHEHRQSWGEAVVWDTGTGEALARFGGHPRQMTDVQFSLNGKLVATSSWDRTARLWDSDTWTELSRLKLEGPVFSFGFSPDASRLITAYSLKEDARSADRAAIWDLASAQQVAHLADPGGVESLAFSRDRKRVAAAGANGTVGIWDTETGSELHRLEVDLDDESWFHILSLDGKRLVTNGQSEALVWDVPTGQLLYRLKQGRFLRSASFSHDGQYVVTGGDDGYARLWETAEGTEVAQFPHESSVAKLALSLDDTRLATATRNEVFVWELASKRMLARLPHSGVIEKISFSPDSQTLVTADGTSVVRHWEIGSAHPERLRLDHEYAVFDVSISPDSTQLAAQIGWADYKHVPVWDLATGKELYRVLHDEPVWDVAIGPDGKRLATASSDRTARVWDATDGRELLRLRHDNNVHEVKFSPDSRWLATFIGGIHSGRHDQWEEDLLRVWDAAGGQAAGIEIGGYIMDFAFSPDGNLLVTGEGTFGAGADQRRFGFFGARIWGVATGKELLRIPTEGPGNFVAFSPDAKTVATLAQGYRGEALRLWDVKTGELLKGLVDIEAKGTDSVNRLAFDSDWKNLAVIRHSYSKEVQIWDVTKGKKKASLSQDNYVSYMTFSPDGRHLATSHSNPDKERGEIVTIWNWDSAQKLSELVTSNKFSLSDLKFTPDGSRIVAAGLGGAVKVWLWKQEDLVSDACSRLERNLTREEWRTYLGDAPYEPTCSGLPSGEPRK